MSNRNYDYKKLYDLIYEMIADLQYVHNMIFADTIILKDKIVLIYNINIQSNSDGFGYELQQHINIIDDTIKVELEIYDDRLQYIIKSKW